MQKEKFFGPACLALRSNVLARSRFTEDKIIDEIQKGLRQVVVLGAGLDTSSIRLGRLHPDVDFFEMDQTETQREKLRLLEKASIDIPKNVKFLPVDFESEFLLDALRAGGVDMSQRILFSWLGVTMYLTIPAIEETLRCCLKAGRENQIVFTFAHKDNGISAIEAAAGEAGETWKSKFIEDEIIALLTKIGFAKCSVIGVKEIEDKYFAGRSDQLRAPQRPFLAVGVA